MEYFMALKDVRIRNAVPHGNLDAYLEDMIFMTELPEEGCYLDYIVSGRLLVSERISRILKAYEPGLRWTPFVLVDPESGRQRLYEQTAETPVSDCIGSRTEFTQAGYIKKLVLDCSGTEGKAFFYIKTRLESFLIVELAVAESLLRRHICGLCFRRVETQHKSLF